MDKVQQTLAEGESIIAYIASTTKEVVKNIRESGKFTKPFEFVLASDTSCSFEMFIKGNKVNGGDYELTTWKTVPIVRAVAQQNYDIHPTKPREYWVAFSSLAGGWGVDNEEHHEYIKSGFLRKNIERAINESIEDFTEQNTL